MFKSRFTKVEQLFNAAKNANTMQDRKTAIVRNATSLGYMVEILIYPKASISEVHIGYMPISGWVVQETVKNPKNKVDGFVICVQT